MTAPAAQAAGPPSRHPRWSVVVNLATWALPIALAVVSMPLLWRELGAAGYGAYVLAASYAAIAASFAPFRGTAQRVASTPADDRAALARAVRGAYLAACLTGTATTAAFVLGAPALVRFAGLDPATDPDALAAFRIAAVAPLALQLAQVARGVLIGRERYVAYGLHLTGATIATTVGTVLLARLGYRAPGLMLWMIAVGAVAAAAGLALTWPRATPREAGPEPRASVLGTAWSIVRFGGVVIATDSLIGIYVLAERMILARAAGVAEVPYYTVPLTLASALQNALATASIVMLPRAAAAAARGDTGHLCRLHARAITMVTAVGIGGSAALAVAAGPLLAAWMDPAFAARTAGVAAILFAAFCVNAVATPIWTLTEGVGRPGRNTVLIAAIAAAGSALALAWAPTHGALGMAMARAMATWLAVPVFVLLGERAILGRIDAALWRGVARHLVPAAVVLLAAEAATAHALEGAARMLVAGGLLLPYAAWVWHTPLFDPDARRAVRRLIGFR
jgi:O-antigen/teichoic acid export membrane protein